VDLDHRRADGGCGLDLRRLGGDEQRDSDARIGKLADGRA